MFTANYKKHLSFCLTFTIIFSIFYIRKKYNYVALYYYILTVHIIWIHMHVLMICIKYNKSCSR